MPLANVDIMSESKLLSKHHARCEKFLENYEQPIKSYLAMFRDECVTLDKTDRGFTSLNVGKFEGAPDISFFCWFDDWNGHSQFRVTYKGEEVLDVIFSEDLRPRYSYEEGSHIKGLDYTNVQSDWVKLLEEIPHWIELQKKELELIKQKVMQNMKTRRIRSASNRIYISPNNNCPECEESKPDDARVEAGMKCSECAYPGGA